MASREQHVQSKTICKEFLTLNKQLGLYAGKISVYFNSYQRRQLMRHGPSKTTTFSSGGSAKLLSIEEAKKRLAV